jgi:hypothetical protein
MKIAHFIPGDNIKSYLSFNRGEDFFRNQPIRNKNCLWQPCLLTDRDEMSNRYRGPSLDASHQVSVHLAKRFQRRRLKKNRPIRNKNCLSHFNFLFSKPCQRQYELLPSLDVCHLSSVYFSHFNLFL